MTDERAVEPIEVVVSHSHGPRRMTTQGLMKSTEAALKRSLDKENPHYWDAIEEIAQARALVNGGMGLKAAGFEPRTPGHDGTENWRGERLKLAKNYRAWDREITTDSWAVVFDVCDGASLAYLDGARKKRNGWARKQLSTGLALWCKIMGKG